MKITKNTMRADGRTVGEAMEADRQFLKSLGIKTSDQMMTPHEIHEDRATAIRGGVLDVLDEVLGGKGWIDQDLPQLFDALEKHLKRWEDRHRQEHGY